MPENFIPDALHKNFMNGRSSPFRGLPKNEMMLMTDRRVMQFLLKVISALDEKQQSDISYDPDLTLMDFWNITQNI